MILWASWEILLRSDTWTVGGAGKNNIASLMCLAVGTNYHLWCLSSPSRGHSFSSSLDLLTYMVKALFQESKKQKQMILLRPEPKTHIASPLRFRIRVGSLLLHSLSMQVTKPVSIQDEKQTQPLGRRGSFHQVALSRISDVTIREREQFKFQDCTRLTDSILKHNEKSLALEYQSKLIMKAMVQSIFTDKYQKVTGCLLSQHILLYIVKICESLSS